MNKIDFDKTRHVYFMGIGGISMSGLAEILLNAGIKVSGSDMASSAITDMLRLKGADVKTFQAAENITDDIDIIVYTAAIKPDNPEFIAATEKGIPMITRAELLGQIMDNYPSSIAVAGTHGKTTTTSMMSYVLMECEKDPTISIGGMLGLIGGNIRVGGSDFFVTEACEYTNSYHSLSPYISIVLNVDNDHLDFFGNIDNIADSFRTFVRKTAPGGAAVINGDSPYADLLISGIKEENDLSDGPDVRIVTFGTGASSKYQARDIKIGLAGNVSYDLYVDGAYRCEVILSLTGEHNAVNSLAVIAAADVLGLDTEKVLTGIRKCVSADRRFQYKGTLPGNRTVIDDYAHHPTEIAATLKVANEIKKGGLWVAFQPHTYSRTKAHLDGFIDVLSQADHVLLADIYAAREIDDGTVSSDDIAQGLIKKGVDAVYLGDFDSIKNYFLKNSKENDLLITMGAGNIVNVGEELLKS